MRAAHHRTRWERFLRHWPVLILLVALPLALTPDSSGQEKGPAKASAKPAPPPTLPAPPATGTVPPAADKPPADKPPAAPPSDRKPSDTPSTPATGKERATGAQPLPIEVHLSDDSVLKLTLKEEKLEVRTPYGTLTIPVADIQQVDIGRRIPPDLAKKIEATIINLGSSQSKVRATATAELLALRDRAYPALVRAAKSDDKEVARRAEELVTRLREALPEDQLERPEYDVVQTATMKISGRVLADGLQVHTVPFGDQQLKLVEVRSLRLPGAVDAPPKDVLPDPGSLTGYQGQVGKVFHFRVAGGGRAGMMAAPGGMVFIGGAVYGTDMYTLDSSLAMAAVHAGALKMGESGIVKVTILGPQDAFVASTRNGITSYPWGGYPGAYKVSKVRGR